MILRALRRLTKRRWSWRRPRPPGRRAGAVVLVVVLAGLVAGGLAQVRIDTGISSFLPSGDSAYEALEEKAASFGGDPVVVLLESAQPRELLLEKTKLMRLLRLEGELSQLPDVAAVYGPATVLNQTAGASQNLLARISGRRDALRNAAEHRAKQNGAGDAEAAAAGDAAVARFDRRYGALLARGLPAGLPTLRNPGFVETVLYTEDGQPKPQWRFVLPTDRTVAVLVRPRQGLDQAAAGRLSDAVRATVDKSALDPAKVTVTGVPVVTSALTERAQRELPVLGAIAAFAVGLVFFVAPWSRRRRARLRPVLVALIGTALTLAAFGWLQHPLSLGVVAFLPILLGIGSDFPFYLSQPGHRRRALVAALAAAAGFGSLALSPLPFVRELGLALAAGIVATVGIALGMRRLFGAVAPARTPYVDGRGDLLRARVWQRVVVLAVALGLAGAGWAALPQLDIESRPDELARGLPELEAARYAEDVLGSSGEVSILLRGKDVLQPEALRWTRQAEERLVRQHGDQLHPIVTTSGLLQFLGDKPTVEQIQAGVELMPSYLTSAVIRPDNNVALMSFGVELRELDQQRALLAEVRTTLPPPPKGYEVELVGLPVAAVQGLDAVSGGRSLINMVGIAAAGLVLVIGLRRRADAGRAVLTILLATGWVLALAWGVSGSLNPLTVAIGSLTTATGCEFAVMLAGAGRRRRHWLWRGVATAAVAGSVGYLILGLSGVAVLREFGLLLAASVVCSYLAAVAVLWALPPREASATDHSDQGRNGVKTMEVAR
ncbi:MMPL family transporter [Haloechinothrix salitolerans]|uniref:MMPL family transporter n=1 Tax=Haloechinothrix salitolerans TaxID=926830 RepID=A0ABW2BUF9_9PSEU